MLDFILTCVAVAGLTMMAIYAVIKTVKSVREIRPSLRHLGRLKIPADCPKTGRDFIVDLECPDGTVVRIAIPVDPNTWEGRGSRLCDTDPRPVGLNLVCPGHYT